MNPSLPRLSRLRRIDTVRLIPSRFAEREDSVLTAIAENLDHLRDLFELDNATNERLIGERGAWYCAFELETALAEIIFHKTVEYQEIGRFDDSVNYQELLADFSSEFHDLRDAPAFAACLDPGSYVASQGLAARLLDAGSLGIIYPSVRRAGGTNLVCFRPALVGNPRRAASFRLTWAGSRQPQVEKLDRQETGGL